MKSNRYFILLAVYYILSLSVGTLAHFHRISIRNAINNAGRNGEPIVASSNGNWLFPARLFTLNRSPIIIQPDLALSYECFFFEKEGALDIFPAREKEYFSHEHIIFPNFNSITIDVTEVVENNPKSPITGMVFYGGLSCFDACITNDAMHLTDRITGDHNDIEFKSAPPWVLESDFYQYPGGCNISPDLDVFIAVLTTASGPTIKPVWRYNIQEGVWAKICDLKVSYPSLLSVGPGGDIFAVTIDSLVSSPASTLPCDIVFLDGRTGIELHRVPNSGYAQIGKRWAAITSWSGMASSITLLDIENNWQATSLGPSLPCNFALYEPPPNGLDGMYENWIEPE
jgi:hypothetical protein